MGTAVSTMALSSSLSLLKSVSLRTLPAISYLNFRQFHPSLAANMPINVGDKVPSVELFEDSPANKVNAAELTAGKKTVIFGVPGAFTPGCSKTHLPGYVADFEKLKAKGVDEIVCLSMTHLSWLHGERTRMQQGKCACWLTPMELSPKLWIWS